MSIIKDTINKFFGKNALAPETIKISDSEKYLLRRYWYEKEKAHYLAMRNYNDYNIKTDIVIIYETAARRYEASLNKVLKKYAKSGEWTIDLSSGELIKLENKTN